MIIDIFIVCAGVDVVMNDIFIKITIFSCKSQEIEIL